MDLKERIKLADNPRTSIKVVTDLCSDSSALVRAKIAAHPKASTELLRLLSKDRSKIVKSIVANHQNISLEDLILLSKDKTVFIQVRHLFQFPTVEILVDFSQSPNELTRAAAASYFKMPVHQLRELSKDKSVKVRAAVAINTSTPIDILVNNLSSDKSSTVRAAAASNIISPMELLDKLSSDVSPSVRLSVAKNTNATDKNLSYIVSNSSLEMLQHIIKFCNSKLTNKTLKTLAIKLKGDYRSWVVHKTNVDNEVLDILSNDRSVFIREQVARHSKISKHTLLHLSFDSNIDVKAIAVYRLKELQITDEILGF